MTVFLHAGLPKTGSTAIQSALANSGDELKRGGVRYWSISENHSWPLRLMLNAVDMDGDIVSVEAVQKAKFGNPKFIENHLRKELCGDIIISAENTTHFDLKSLENLTYIIGDAISILYIREPRGWFTSKIQQYIKSGLGLDAAVEKFLGTRTIRSRIEDLSSLFQTDVRLYQSTGLIADFCQAIGQPQLRLQERRENDRLAGSAVWLLEAMHREGGLGHTGWARALLTDFEGSRFELPSPVMAKLLNARTPDIEWASSRLGVDLMSVGEPVEGADGRLNDDTARLLHRMAREICDSRSRDARARGMRLRAAGNTKAAAKAFAQASAYHANNDGG